MLYLVDLRVEMLMETLLDLWKVLLLRGEVMEYLRAKNWLESLWDVQLVLM